jgi:hypothetical protein
MVVDLVFYDKAMIVRSWTSLIGFYTSTAPFPARAGKAAGFSDDHVYRQFKGLQRNDDK